METKKSTTEEEEEKKKKEEEKKIGETLLKVLFTVIFASLAILVTFFDWGKENITTMTTTLTILSFFPWIVKYIKSIEAYGVKANFEITKEEESKLEGEFNNLATNTRNMKQFRSLKNNEELEEMKAIYDNSSQIISGAEETISKLILSKYELKKVILLLAKKYKIRHGGSLILLARKLEEKKIISHEEYTLINEMLKIWDKAMSHDINKIDNRQLTWINDKFMEIIELLCLK